MGKPQTLEEFRQEAGGIAARARELQRPWHEIQPISELVDDLFSLSLAHYTSLEAMVSMLQAPDGGLRLSDTSTMNDPEEGCATSECSFVLHLMQEKLGEDSWVWKRYGAAHVCCFVGIERTDEQTIDAGDDLLFWRLYGSDCRGVSIKIPPPVSGKLVEKSMVGRITYADELSIQMDWSVFSTFLKDLEELHSCAMGADLWPKISQEVLVACDPLFKQRFLRKRSHYEMEQEYRAVVFLSEDDEEDVRYPIRGKHVQYGRVRQYVQIQELSCVSILETGSQITIGSNVPEPDNARDSLRELIKGSAEIPSAVSIRVSKVLYRSR